jgi:hypothetical protein
MFNVRETNIFLKKQIFAESHGFLKKNSKEYTFTVSRKKK